MKLNVVTCKDILMGCFLQPKFIEKVPEAEFESSLRALNYADDTQLGFYQNYEFWSLGSFDDQTGVFTSDLKLIGSFADKVSEVLIRKGKVSNA